MQVSSVVLAHGNWHCQICQVRIPTNSACVVLSLVNCYCKLFKGKFPTLVGMYGGGWQQPSRMSINGEFCAWWVLRRRAPPRLSPILQSPLQLSLVPYTTCQKYNGQILLVWRRFETSEESWCQGELFPSDNDAGRWKGTRNFDSLSAVPRIITFPISLGRERIS